MRKGVDYFCAQQSGNDEEGLMLAGDKWEFEVEENGCGDQENGCAEDVAKDGLRMCPVADGSDTSDSALGADGHAEDDEDSKRDLGVGEQGDFYAFQGDKKDGCRQSG